MPQLKYVIILFLLFDSIKSKGQILPSIPSMEQVFGWPSDNNKEQPTDSKNVNIDYQSGLVTINYVNANYNYYQGPDGRIVCYPYHWRRITGSDGRVVAYPTNWRTTEGKNGSVLSFPPSGGWSVVMDLTGRKFFLSYSNWTIEKGSDGYWTPRPISNWTWEQGRDGRKIVRPTSNWTWEQGTDGRKAVRPISGWTWDQGQDGRKVVRPSSGWTWQEGRDGRKVVYPNSGWTWEQGADGRKVIRPSTGWTWQEGSDGRKVVRPSGNSKNLTLIFIHTEYLALFDALRSELSEEELTHFILYYWINVDRE
jgi:hypothetical protein